MEIEDQLRERLRKVEALYFGAMSVGEREAAGAAAERLKAKLDEAARLDPPVEMKFSLPDEWSVRLFIALCRRYGAKVAITAVMRKLIALANALLRDNRLWAENTPCA